MFTRPFTSFNFIVAIAGDAVPYLLCRAVFSECDGLEINMQPKTIREGGNNARPIHLVGPVSYGQLTLRRGMTLDSGLWYWFETILAPDGGWKRADATVMLMSSDHQHPNAVWQLTGCLPVKLRAPSLNAKDGQVAIEEMQIAYETLTRA